MSRALKIKEHILGWYHNDVAIGCVNLSNLMRDKTDYKAAIEYAEKGLDIFKVWKSHVWCLKLTSLRNAFSDQFYVISSPI